METLKNIWNGQKFFIGIVIGLIIGMGVGYAMFDKSVSSKESGTSDASILDDESEILGGSTSETPSVLVTGENAVAVNDQVAGSIVTVTMATFSQPGWVVIREGEAGMPGRVLGAHRYDAGIHLAEVELLRATEAGKIYQAALHIDNGDKEFNLDTDVPMKGADGKLIADSFQAY